MCDRRYFDEDIQEECCPDQPVCENCWRYIIAELRKEKALELEAHIALLQERGVIPRFAKKVPRLPIVVPPKPDGSIYELTLTLPEGTDDPYLLRTTLQKVVNSRMYEVINWAACIELTAKGTPHLHAIIYSKKKYCDGSKLKGKPISYPHRFEFKRVRSEHDYLNYIKKEAGNPVILDYCAKKGIPQYWKCHIDVHTEEEEPTEEVAAGDA